MNFSFLKLLNKVKTALLIRRYRLDVKHTKQNILFLQFLKENGLVSAITKNCGVLSIFLAYDADINPILNNASIALKKGHKRPRRHKTFLNTNNIITLKTQQGKSSRLLARFL